MAPEPDANHAHPDIAIAPHTPLRVAAAAVLLIAIATLSALALLALWKVEPGGDAPLRAGLANFPEPRLQSAPQARSAASASAFTEAAR